MMDRDNTWAVLTVLLALTLAGATASHTGLTRRTRLALLFTAVTAFALVFWHRLTP